MSPANIDYYAVLGVSSSATAQQIRDAYKRAALKSHPDRVATDSPERESRTKEFQRVNDAYYTLSDPGRRREYDASRSYFTSADEDDTTQAGDDSEDEIPLGGDRQQRGTGWASGFPWSFGFGGKSKKSEEDMANEQFSSVFEEMMREEGLGEEDTTDPHHKTKPTGKFWSVVGGVSGGALGFIVANVPGALAGAVAGNRLGSVRDVKGKSVYEVFQELPQADKARFLTELATKVFATAISG